MNEMISIEAIVGIFIALGIPMACLIIAFLIIRNDPLEDIYW